MKNLSKRISLILKELRKERGWSLDKAALETGVSKAMLGQIERQESSPTIATLWKIATGFQTSFSSFIEDLPTETQQPIIRRGRTRQLHPQDQKIRVMTVFPYDSHLNFEIFIIELLPQCEQLSSAHELGVIESVVVAQGEMEVMVKGKWLKLSQGQGLRFNADQPHGYRNFTSTSAVVHDVIYYPPHR